MEYSTTMPNPRQRGVLGTTIEVATRSLVQEARQLLSQLGDGAMSIAAYDTAWVARLSQADRADVPAFPKCLEWLRENQQPDGSWGGQNEYYCDRIISTLAAVLSLSRWNRHGRDDARCERGLQYIWEKAGLLAHDPFETVGFELIVPTLLEEAQRLGLRLPYGLFDRYRQVRDKKLARIPARMLYNRQNPAVYSLEFMGNNLDRELAAHVQEDNGSVGDSPSATAYFLSVWGEEPRARQYISRVTSGESGGVVFCFPLEIFERAWVLYNFDLAGLLDEVAEEAQPHIGYLRGVWDDREGVAFSRWYSARDLDDTAVTFKLLHRAAQLWGDPQYRVSLDVFETYAEKDHFRTFRFETDPSLSANIHLLDALLLCPEEPAVHPMMEKILSFMRRTRSLRAFWFDKWHASPYYVTAHAILAAVGGCPDLVADAVFWIVQTQNADGSWGYYHCPTVEETAYCLQALLTYERQVGGVPAETLDKGADYLRACRWGQDYPPLWISKTLFAPLHVIESAVISALAMYEQEIG